MMSKTLKALTIAGLLAGTTAATAYAYSHTSYQHILTESQVNSVILGARSQGFNLVVANQRGQINARTGTVSFVVLLRAGQDYRVHALCDNGCNGLRLSLRNGVGHELATDRADQELPRFNIHATYTGAYVVTLQVADCRAHSCNVGAVVLTRRTPSPEAGQLPHHA